MRTPMSNLAIGTLRQNSLAKDAVQETMLIASKKERFAKLETEQLEGLIEQDWQEGGSTLNAEETLAILEILEERSPSGVTDDEIEAEWQTFLTDYLPVLEETGETLYEGIYDLTEPAVKHRSKTSMLTRVAAILAVVVVSSSLFVYKTYSYNVWENFAKWTAEIFRLDNQGAPIEEPMFPNAADPRLQPLYEAMKDLEIPTTLAPTWIPERFQATGIIDSSDTPFKGVVNTFVQEQEVLMLIFEHSTDTDTIYEKDDTDVTTLKINGVTYYFMSNLAQNRVVWSVNQFECSINGTVSYEELEQMVRSIYER